MNWEIAHLLQVSQMMSTFMSLLMMTWQFFQRDVENSLNHPGVALDVYLS